MPNNIANRLKVIGKDINDIEDFLDFICGEDEGVIIDFNNIVPMPQCLKDTEESTRSFDGVQYYLQQVGETELLKQLKPYFAPLKDFSSYDKEKLEELYAIGERYYNNYKECGYFTWYKWSIDNWGTKWNAYETTTSDVNDENTHIIYFQTAWNGVPDIIATLTEKYPDLTFDYAYADEDMGSNCGEGYGEDGEFTFRYVPSGDDAMELFIKAWDYDADDFYQDDDGEWHNREWDEDEDDEEDDE